MTDDLVIAHYTRRDALSEIESAMSAAGVDPARPTLDNLSSFDQFHTGGKAAVNDLGELAQMQPGERVLDVGGGVGGPARLVAHRFGVHITVLDLTPSFIEAGRELTRRVGLEKQVQHQQGSALEMPFPDAAFDVIWTQHCTMNIPDKPRMYAECARVLRLGGRLAMHEIVAGPLQPVHFPAPWSVTPEASFLLTAAELRAAIEAAGFQVCRWDDLTAEGIAWFTRQLETSGRFSPQMSVRAQNLLRSYQEGRAEVVRALAVRP